MSTNKTPHYQLHSWVKEDTFLMDEMNENFGKLDEKLKAEVEAINEALADELAEIKTTVETKADKTEVATLQATVDTKEDKTTVTSLQNTVNNKANSSTVTTLEKKVQELSAALGKKVEVVTGQYTHNSTANRVISLGRKPFAVLIEHISGMRSSGDPFGILVVEGVTNQYVSLTEDGFKIIKVEYLNTWEGSHVYIAFFLA